MPGLKGKGSSMELTIEIRPRPGKSLELYQTLQALLPTIRNDKRCRDCRISVDGEVFFLSSDWEAQSGLERYLRSTNGLVLFGAIDLLSERAAVKTGRDAPWEAIDVLKRMRRKRTAVRTLSLAPETGEKTNTAGQGTTAEQVRNGAQCKLLSID
jgi:quinol monooxygenase YgiN